MPPRKTEIRTALEMVPHHILSKMVDENGLNFTSRKSSELIEKLLELDWTDERFDVLKERLARIEYERTPKNRYIALIGSVKPSLGDPSDMGRVREVLETHSASFDEDDKLKNEGFQISVIQDNVIQGSHWSESLSYSLTPTQEIETNQTLYETQFKLDFSNDIVFLNSSMPMKAGSVLNQLENLAIDVSDFGHQTLTNDQANQRVQDFVDEVDNELRERHPQSTLGDSDTEVLEVDMVNMLFDEDNLKDIRISGHTDIIGDDEVARFKREYDARIHRLKGNFELDNNWFKFTAGFTENMGQVNIKKKGRVEEKPQLVDHAFDFLYEHYKKHFIDV